MLPEAHLEMQLPENAVVASRLNDSVASEEPATEYEALVLKLVADYINSAQVILIPVLSRLTITFCVIFSSFN